MPNNLNLGKPSRPAALQLIANIQNPHPADAKFQTSCDSV